MRMRNMVNIIFEVGRLQTQGRRSPLKLIAERAGYRLFVQETVRDVFISWPRANYSCQLLSNSWREEQRFKSTNSRSL